MAMTEPVHDGVEAESQLRRDSVAASQGPGPCPESTDNPPTAEAETHAQASDGQAVLDDKLLQELLAGPVCDSQDDLYHNRRTHLYTREDISEAWSKTTQSLETYSNELMTRWTTEIDTYLVYAGLFSAILTALNVQSYPMLQPAATEPGDVNTTLLQRISSQLSSFATNPPLVNFTVPTSQDALAASPQAIPVAAIWLNTLWFSSLVLSLPSAFVGIMVKQWINHCKSDLHGGSRQVARLRQYRLHSLKAWHVADIVTAIPMLLQLALGLFLAGLLILLWMLHSTVAAVTSALVGLLAIFTIGATVLPLFKASCAYVSPQTLALYATWQPVRRRFQVVRRTLLQFAASLALRALHWLSTRTR
ncbi:hypothetical protein BV20DRAFT_414701 [Pilatotrama ljubarskyi]|nr:hypothetical protein BV20DRAFT_414701 [Pilatotrama ljubarskyi]